MLHVCVVHRQVMKPTHEPHQRLRLGDNNLLVALDSSNQRLLKYQELDSPAAAAAAAAGGALRDSSSGHQGGHHHHHHHQGRRGRSSQVWKLDASFWSERDCVQVIYSLELRSLLIGWRFG
jgi:hypothetical protein